MAEMIPAVRFEIIMHPDAVAAKRGHLWANAWLCNGYDAAGKKVVAQVGNTAQQALSAALRPDELVLGGADWDAVRAAFDRVKEFPEFQPDERARWLDLRQAVERLLERHGPR